jgi:hypothetical protein
LVGVDKPAITAVIVLPVLLGVWGTMRRVKNKISKD